MLRKRRKKRKKGKRRRKRRRRSKGRVNEICGEIIGLAGILSYPGAAGMSVLPSRTGVRRLCLPLLTTMNIHFSLNGRPALGNQVPFGRRLIHTYYRFSLLLFFLFFFFFFFFFFSPLFFFLSLPSFICFFPFLYIYISLECFCQGFCLWNFCTSSSFSFIFSSTLRPQSDV